MLGAALAGVAVVVGLWAGLALIAARLPPGLLKEIVGFLPACVTLLRRLRADPRVPLRVKVALLVAALWVVSPIDLIPEFLPVIDVTAREEHDPVTVAQARTEYARDGQLSQATIDRLCCDAAFTRVIKDGPSQILDVGRKTRNISPALRRALIVRDGGCVEEGCDRGPGSSPSPGCTRRPA